MATMSIVSKIKDQEEKRYGIDIDVETPTVVEYFKENLKGKGFSLSDSLSTLAVGFGSAGLADSNDNKIYIFNKHQLSIPFFETPFRKKLSDAMISYTTFHEIRHILQSEKEELFTDYELFCILLLAVMNNKYLVNSDFHDSQYFEIDANIYGASETLKLFSDDKKISKLFDGILSDHLYEKYIYDFEYFFKCYLKDVKYGFEDGYYKLNPLINSFFDIDGNFKSISEIIESSVGVIDTKLITKIVTSDAYLSSLDLSKLSDRELDFLKVSLERAMIYLEEDIGCISDLYNNKKISKFDYRIGSELIDKQIEKKEKYLEKTFRLDNESTFSKIRKRLIKQI